METILPEAFCSRMHRLLGESYDAFAVQIKEKESVRALRVNAIKTTPEALLPTLPGNHTPIPYTDDGFLTALEKPGHLPAHHAGAFYMQDPSAMSTVQAIDVKPGWAILDCCAAPGGKTTQLSAYAGERGVVVANEYVSSRCRILQGNVERMGCRNTLVTNLEPAALAECYPDQFDLVVVDAPCSGEGMFRKNSAAITEWSEEAVALCAARQRHILANAARCVAPGGYLLYSTCTFAPAENEENVIWFLDTHSAFSLTEVNAKLLPYTAPGLSLSDRYDLSLTRRFYPHIAPGEGQYVALMHRREEGETTAASRESAKKTAATLSLSSPSREEQAIAEAFLRDTLQSMPSLPLRLWRRQLCFCPEIPLPSHGVFSCGVPLGTVQKGRVEPHHHFFSAYGEGFLRRYALNGTSPEANAYLHGMTLSADGRENGWCVVTVDGCALGGGKMAGGILKNHYPKGLRQV